MRKPKFLCPFKKQFDRINEWDKEVVCEFEMQSNQMLCNEMNTKLIQ